MLIKAMYVCVYPHKSTSAKRYVILLCCMLLFIVKLDQIFYSLWSEHITEVSLSLSCSRAVARKIEGGCRIRRVPTKWVWHYIIMVCLKWFQVPYLTSTNIYRETPKLKKGSKNIQVTVRINSCCCCSAFDSLMLQFCPTS